MKNVLIIHVKNIAPMCNLVILYGTYMLYIIILNKFKLLCGLGKVGINYFTTTFFFLDVDHTCYTISTAGSEGFLSLLPVYLDHILYPTIKVYFFKNYLNIKNY